jgi:hypothetical protein
MKSFKEFLFEEPKKSESETEVQFFAHFKSAHDPNHSIEQTEKGKKKPTEFFAHFKSQHDKKHNIDEGVSDSYKKDMKVFNSNLKAVSHHEMIPLSDKEQNSLDHYTENGSGSLNRGLVKGSSSASHKKHIKQLDKITNHPKNKLKSSVVAYSGISAAFHKKLSTVKPGKTVSSPSYISTTLDRGVAESFAHGADKIGSKRPFIQFHLPKGYSKGRHIEHVTQNPDEEEFLLARGQKFRYLKKTEHKSENFFQTHIVHHLEPIG